MTIEREPTLIVVANEYERRYYYAGVQAGNGMGYVTFEDHVQKYGGVPGEVHVYRLDVEATQALTRAVHAEQQRLDKMKNMTDKMWKSSMTKVIVSLTGIREKTRRH